MKVAPVSADLLIKLALGAAVVGALVYAAGRLKSALPSAADVGAAVNPLSDQNLAYRGVNAVGATLATAPDAAGKNADGSWSLGGWFYDVTH